MRFPYPRSFLALLIAGFALVAAPLLFALGKAIEHLDRLADRSRETVYQATTATQNSQRLLEQLMDMERSARQFVVLGDATFFFAYENTHKEFSATVRELDALPFEAEQHARLTELAKREKSLFARLASVPHDSLEAIAVAEEFATLAPLAQTIHSHGTRLIHARVEAMQQIAADAQHRALVQMLWTVPLVLGQAGVFAYLIARPIAQLKVAIHRLGAGEFAAAIPINGPRDLQGVGQQLDWLRLRLMELEAQRTRLLQHISHELKTPLAGLHEGIGLLADGVGGNLSAPQDDIVRILQHSCEQLERRIQSLLDLSMAQRRHAALDLHPIPLRPIVEQVVQSHRLAIMSKEIDLQLSLGEVHMNCDGPKLTTVVDNLLSNAVKYSPRGGVIEINLRRDGHRAVLDVRDSGPGIDPGESSKIFEAFYQGKAPHDSHLRGTGLGLSIAKEYVTAHRGRIEALDHGVRGTRFHVELPLNPLEGAA
jgi:two-component system sensor histidine kinase GlrK